jgi:MFS family permease
LAFEVFAVATLLSNSEYADLSNRVCYLTDCSFITVVVGFFADASASKNKPFLLSVVIMVSSTIIFFVATTPEMILVSRAIQGASTTFTWVTGLAYLVAKVGEGELGAYVGWTTVGVAVGEIIGPMVGGPIYDYFGHWAAFAVVEALLLVDILLRVLAKDNKPGVHTETPVEQNTNASIDQDLETNSLLENGRASSTDYNTITNGHSARGTDSHRSALSRLAWEWLGTVFTLIVIFLVRGALEVVS